MTAVCCLRRNSDEGSLSLKVVSTAEELQQAFAIRSIVFMGEQRCPYNEEFDGNDFAATHILGLVDGEPAVTGRVRYFGEFVKFERFAVRPEFRDRGFGHELTKYLIDFSLKKGFSRIYFHIQKRHLRFFKQYGFRPLRAPFNFSDHEFLEIAAEFEASADSLSLEHGPMVLNRPEGKWNEEGILERSISRAPTNPMIKLQM